jgi:hypothetical protein
MIGVVESPNYFPVANERSVSIKSATDGFRNAFGTEPITVSLQTFGQLSQLESFREIRNILAHRGHPGRNIHASIGGLDEGVGAKWVKEMAIDKNTTRVRRNWLITELNILMKGLQRFVENHW